MKRKWFHTKDDPLYLSLLLVVVLFFVSILAVCFSFLIMSERQFMPVPESWQRQKVADKVGGGKQGATLDPEQISVAELSGEVTKVEDDGITIKTMVYSGEEKDYKIKLNDEAFNKFSKFVETGRTDKSGLPELQKQKFDFKKLKEGDFVTLSFPLGVPLSEIESGALAFEEIIVNDEFDSSSISE